MNEPGDRGIVLLQDLGVALARLTRIPVPGVTPKAGNYGAPVPGGSDPVRILWAYPVIGTLMGAAGAVAYGLCTALGLPPLLSAVVAVGCMMALGGARPENSLVRCAERLAGGAPAAPESAAKDSPGGPLGTVGIATLVLVLAVRVGALAALADAAVVAGVLVAAGALSQAVAAVARHYLPPGVGEADSFEDEDADDEAPDESAPRPGSGGALAAALIGSIVAALVLPFATGGAIVVAAAGGLAVAMLAGRAVGAARTDVVLATQQAAEIAVLVIAAAAGGAA